MGYQDINFLKFYPTFNEIEKIEAQLVQALFTRTNYYLYERVFFNYERLLASLSETDFFRLVTLRPFSFINVILFLRMVKIDINGSVRDLAAIFPVYLRFLEAYGLQYTGLLQLYRDTKCARSVDLHIYPNISRYLTL